MDRRPPVTTGGWFMVPEADSEKVFYSVRNMKYATVIGTYYRILGWTSLAYLLLTFALAFCTLSTYWSDKLSIDLTFFIWLWLGSRLKRRDSTARKWAIGISVFVTLFTLAYLLTGIGITYLGSYEFAPPDIRYYLIGAGMILLVGLPGLLLLRRRAREEFKPIPDKEGN